MAKTFLVYFWIGYSDSEGKLLCCDKCWVWQITYFKNRCDWYSYNILRWIASFPFITMIPTNWGIWKNIRNSIWSTYIDQQIYEAEENRSCISFPEQNSLHEFSPSDPEYYWDPFPSSNNASLAFYLVWVKQLFLFQYSYY